MFAAGAVCCVLAAAACGLDVVGARVDPTLDAGTPSAPPSAPPPTAEEAGPDAPSDEDVPTLPLDDGGCRPPILEADGGRVLNARASVQAKTLDGLLDDFDRTCPLYVLDETTAAGLVGKPPGGTSASVYVEWTPSDLWVGVDVSHPAPAGTMDASIEQNDSVEVYVSGLPAARNGDYGTYDHHYIVDWAGRQQHFTAPNWLTRLPFSGAKVTTRSGGYVVEAKIGVADAPLGATLAKGRALAFDALLNVGTGQKIYLLLGQQPHAACTCASCVCNYGPDIDYPYNDSLVFVPLTLR
jgi:hypothetical protein